MRRNTLTAGFTLLEVLVVLLIASIVMAILVSVLGSSFEILRTGETRAQLNSNARVALNYMCDDIGSASSIPLAFDRDLNGYPDDDPTPADGGNGYDEDAIWRVAWWRTTASGRVPEISSSFWFSEAWSDRIQTIHDSSTFTAGQPQNTPGAIPRPLRDRMVEYRSLFRLAIPASNDMPYYLALEWDRNGDGVVDPLNTGTGNPGQVGDGLGEIDGYPEVIPVGPSKESAAVIQDLFYKLRDEPGQVRRMRQIPVSSNITRIKYEYMHEVPVYQSRCDGTTVYIYYQDLTDGSIDAIAASSTRSSAMEDMVPLVAGYELRVIDVAYNADYTDSGTSAQYVGTHYRLADQYPEGLNTDKEDGTHPRAPFLPTSEGLGHLVGTSPSGWNCADFYNVDTTGDEIADNAPIDRLAYVTTSLSGGAVVEGGWAALRPDMEALHGRNYYDETINPTQIGDMGDADGIPDGDGVPDDPVPGWWLPYLRAVRVTVVATPKQVMEERRAASGKEGKSGQVVYYRLDSPAPFADADRTQPLYNLKEDYIGTGKDVVMTKTVPVNYAYRAELVTDPRNAQLSSGGGSLRRVELNYFRATQLMFPDPLDPDVRIKPRTPAEKLQEKDPQP